MDNIFFNPWAECSYYFLDALEDFCIVFDAGPDDIDAALEDFDMAFCGR